MSVKSCANEPHQNNAPTCTKGGGVNAKFLTHVLAEINEGKMVGNQCACDHWPFKRARI